MDEEKKPIGERDQGNPEWIAAAAGASPGATDTGKASNKTRLGIAIVAIVMVVWWGLDQQMAFRQKKLEREVAGDEAAIVEGKIEAGLLLQPALSGQVVENGPAKAIEELEVGQRKEAPKHKTRATEERTAAAPVGSCVNGAPTRTFATRRVPLRSDDVLGKIRFENRTPGPMFVVVKEVNTERFLESILMIAGTGIIEPGMSKYVKLDLYSEADWCNEADGWAKGKKTEVDGILKMEGGVTKVVLGVNEAGYLSVYVGPMGEGTDGSGAGTNGVRQ